MADKGNTWFGGAGVITPQPVLSHPTRAVEPRSSNSVGVILLVGAGAILSMLAFTAVPEPWAWEGLRVMAVALVLVSLFLIPEGRLKPAFIIWAMMLMSECIFFREGDASATSKAYALDFPTAVYGEVVMWGLCMLAVLMFSARIRGYLKHLFGGTHKWPTLLAILCVVSSVYAEKPVLGFVWGFKLTLAVLLLLLCSFQIRDFRDTTNFLRFTIWAYVVIVLDPVIIAMLRGDLFDETGRMSTVVSPNALSPAAGVVVLLALTLYSKRKGEGLYKSAFVLGLGACVVMILAASKTGIMAAMIAGGLYFIVCRRFGSAMTFVAATLSLVAILALTTPLGGYLHDYRQGEGAESLSGRTILWTAAEPAILNKPILGHGYMSSEFISMELRDLGWAAPQLHNGFLESAYNNGAIGLLLMLIIIVTIPVNLFRVLLKLSPLDPVYRVSAGCLALFTFLIINACFNSTFGGKTTYQYMLLLALLVVSSKLLAQSRSQKESKAISTTQVINA